jgi:thymidylate synthase
MLMHIKRSTLDDVLATALTELLKVKDRMNPTKGANRELSGVIIELSNPRARLSQTETKGTLFSCLGELFWYLSGSNRLDFIEHYIPLYRKFAESDGTIWGAYGPRMFDMRGVDQLATVAERLKSNPDTRKAVVQIFNAEDIPTEQSSYADVPCTCMMQFMIRNGKLDMIVFMRSNDAFKGLPHDIFCFTMIQELMARTLGIELGLYKHMVGSLHLYDTDERKARDYLSEGFQSQNFEMPPMPDGNPWQCVREVLAAEEKIRLAQPTVLSFEALPSYWQDIIRAFQIFAVARHIGQDDRTALKQIAAIKQEMSTSIYDEYIRRREKKAEEHDAQPVLI